MICLFNSHGKLCFLSYQIIFNYPFILLIIGRLLKKIYNEIFIDFIYYFFFEIIHGGIFEVKFYVFALLLF